MYLIARFKKAYLEVCEHFRRDLLGNQTFSIRAEATKVIYDPKSDSAIKILFKDSLGKKAYLTFYSKEIQISVSFYI